MRMSLAPAVSQRRLAVFTASPITVYSSRRSEPTLPANTSPKLMPIPMASSASTSAKYSRATSARIGINFGEVYADPDGELGATLLLPLRVELLERCQLIERAPHRAVGVVLVRHGRAPHRHDRVPDELVERAAVFEHDLHHLGEILREERGDGVRTHRLRHRREATNVREEE